MYPPRTTWAAKILENLAALLRTSRNPEHLAKESGTCADLDSCCCTSCRPLAFAQDIMNIRGSYGGFSKGDSALVFVGETV